MERVSTVNSLTTTTSDTDVASAQQNCLGLKVRTVSFNAREGLAACVVPCPFRTTVSSSCSLSSSVRCKHAIAIFGGRHGPNRPLNELLFFDYLEWLDGSASFQAPIDVRGTAPAPRWGHSFTAVVTSTSLPETSHSEAITATTPFPGEYSLALVVGGRNDSQALASAHVLSLVAQGTAADESSQGTAHLVWSEVIRDDANPSCPRFYHAAAMTSNNQLFVFGGLGNVQHVLGMGGDEDAEHQQTSICGFVVDSSCSPTNSTVKPLPILPLSNCFGHTVSLLSLELPRCESSATGGSVPETYSFISIGGIPREIEDSDSDSLDDCPPLRCVTLTAAPPAERAGSHEDTSMSDSTTPRKWTVHEHPLYADTADNDHDDPSHLDLGSLVHHTSHAIPTHIPNEYQVLVIGGGVQGFAFGPIFSESYSLTARLIDACKRVPDNDKKSSPPMTTDNLYTAINANGSCLGQSQNSGKQGPEMNKITAPLCGNSDSKRETTVLYVAKRDAKTVKTLLEESRLLDKEFRMTPAVGTPIPAYRNDSNDKVDHDPFTSTVQQEGTTNLIAVPVTPECLGFLLDNGTQQQKKSSCTLTLLDVQSLKRLVKGTGRQTMPYSTAVFAARKKTHKKIEIVI